MEQVYNTKRYQGAECIFDERMEDLKKKRLKQLIKQAKKRQQAFELNRLQSAGENGAANENSKLHPSRPEESQTVLDSTIMQSAGECSNSSVPGAGKRTVLSQDEDDSQCDSTKKKLRSKKYKSIGKDVVSVTAEQSMLDNMSNSTVVDKHSSSPNTLHQPLPNVQNEKSTSNTSEVSPTKVCHEGFTIIGEVEGSKKDKVKRVLPEWLANPTVIHVDLKKNSIAVVDVPGLDASIVSKLHSAGITHLFPVQSIVVPWLLNRNTSALCCRPRDICVSAPTGSGKTLAFVLPIVQVLKHRAVQHVRALVVLPVRDLAIQVYKVFTSYCQGTTLNACLVTGQKAFNQEQETLVRKGVRGYHSLVDIIVATPGRLMDHIQKTEGFSLRNLRFLVLDEADRMMDEINQGWLTEVEKAVSGSGDRCDTNSLCSFQHHPLTACSFGQVTQPVQKLLYSATLSQDPEKLQQLSLYNPKLFTSLVKPVLPDSSEVALDDKALCTEIFAQKNAGEFIGKYTTPAELKEFYINCEQNIKPLIVWHLIHSKRFNHALCFTKSVESTHRLYLVLKQLGGIRVIEFSSSLRGIKREKMLKQFSAGKVDILVCSDVMARGMDVENVDCVICYDAPTLIKTYIHRIGRTARAGREGAALTLLQSNQVGHFQGMMKLAGKKSVSELILQSDEIQQHVEKYQQTLETVGHVVAREQMSLSVRKNPVQKKVMHLRRSKLNNINIAR